MDEMIRQMTERVGIDRATAEKVATFLKEHASDLPRWLGSSDVGKQIADKLPGGLGGMMGGRH